MSMHINLVKSERKLLDSLDLALSFFAFFNLFVNKIKMKESGEVIYEEELKELNRTDIINKINSVKDIGLLNIEFLFAMKNILGYLNINNHFDSKIFGDIEVDIFPDKIGNSNMNKFFDLLRYKTINKEDLDKFFFNHKQILSKAYIDINEEGENNPFDGLYEYGTTGYVFFIKLLKAVELLSEEDKEFLELYTKIRGSDKNYVSSVLWHNEKIRNYAFRIANENNIVAQEGSFKLYADDVEDLKKSYKEMAEKILNPIFLDIPSIEEQVNKVSTNL